MRVGIAAAGSGGHVFPALAVADALRGMGLSHDDIVFFGGNRMEATTVPEAGYRFIELDIHGMRRSLSSDNLRLALKVRKAARVIESVVSMLDIGVMLAFGGYVSGPAAQAANRASIPLAIHEANAVPGIANRMVAGRADLVMVGCEEARGKLKQGIVVGNPLRKAFSDFDRASLTPVGLQHFGLDGTSKVLGIVGGSLGASALNDIAERIATDERRDFTIIHLCGRDHLDALARTAADDPTWIVRAFEDDMTRLYAIADLVVSRAGAMTIAELEATGTPAIVVPLPAGRRYQERNAAELERVGGALVMDQADGSSIVEAVFALMPDEGRRFDMAERARAIAHLDAAEQIAKRVLELIRG
ncbi:MAG: UDP-N-acetylglucosamine--N-acetylmuramyl-(pentapeptide) pyrophosphoryl-undecaprenol N-acetylglucosamine transferase [Acidimicrobiia bacterium]